MSSNGFRDIVYSDDPLSSWLEFALETKNASYTSAEIQRYRELMETAFLADEGENIAGKPWAEYVAQLEGESKFEAAVHSLAETLNASEKEANQFISIIGATAEVLDGANLEEVEELLDENLDSIKEEAVTVSQMSAAWCAPCKSLRVLMEQLSEEYKDRAFTGKQYCIDNNIELHYHLRRHKYSSTELRNRVYTMENAKRTELVPGEVLDQYSPEILNKYEKS